MVIALMVQADACTQIAVQVVASCHGGTAENRQPVLVREAEGSQGILIQLLYCFPHRLPHAETLRPSLHLRMNFRIEIAGDG
ncbi:hypothetical protein SDC9_141762 [bioreactor metagenome]|uniref:Uncharacterized protein n=1 Tax=bioreactor metagenome TaxID=1076179 RepID=A0A645DYL4_9ZZZZ